MTLMSELNWDTFIAFAALFLTALIGLSRMFEKSLSIREHDEFRSAVKDEFKDIREREIDTLRDRLSTLEKTRPTNETLNSEALHIRERLQYLEKQLSSKKD